MTKPYLTIYIRVKITLILITIVVFASFSQSSVGIGTVAPHQSALLELSSTNKGFLPSRMTEAEMNAINNPARGLMIYCTSCIPNGVYIYENSKFRMLQFFENPLKYLYIADVSVARGTTSFVISPILIPSEAAANYSLIDPPSEVFISGTTEETRINIPTDINDREYNITVKAIGNGDYNGETRASFKLNITRIPLEELSIADVSITKGTTTSFIISSTLTPSGATADYSLIDPPAGVSINGRRISIAADVNAGEYDITVKVIGNASYNGETRATFKLNITPIALMGLSIADVSITRGTTSFNISPTLRPSGATVDYYLITNPIGGIMEGTTINIAANIGIRRYNITVKAIGKGNYNGETEATFKLNVARPPTRAECFRFSTGIILGYHCSGSVSDLVIPASIGGVEVQSIAARAFKGSGINSVIIPNTMRSIGYAAFNDNNLTSVFIPDSVREIKGLAFGSNYNLRSVSIKSGITYVSYGRVRSFGRGCSEGNGCIKVRR